MGLKKNEQINYLNIVNGKIARKCNPEVADSQKITNKEGVDKYYLLFDSLEGYLESISWKNPPEQHSEYSANWILRVKDESETYQLQISFGSGFSNSFFCQLRNINPEEPVILIPSIKKNIWEGKEKEQRTIFVKQNDEALKWVFTKAAPGDLPEIDVTENKKGKKFYDDTDRNEFFKGLAQEYNEARKSVRKDEPELVKEEMKELETVETDDDSDLPF